MDEFQVEPEAPIDLTRIYGVGISAQFAQSWYCLLLNQTPPTPELVTSRQEKFMRTIHLEHVVSANRHRVNNCRFTQSAK